MSASEKVDAIAKEICYYDGGGPACDIDCKRCNWIYWKKYRKIVELVLDTNAKLEKKKK